MSDIHMTLTDRKLKSLRVLYGLKQSELAQAIGRSQSWISLIEAGKILPQDEQARKIAEVLSKQ